jgi:hypothetical protein
MHIFPRRQWTSRLGTFPARGLSAGSFEEAQQSIPYPGSLLTQFTYPSSTLNLTVGNPLSAQTPTILPSGARIRYFSLLGQTFPAGLALDPVTGVLSGTPTTPSAATVYRIYAHAGWSYVAQVTITVT